MQNNYQFNLPESTSGKLAIFFIAISPLFHLALNDWTGIAVVTAAVFSIIHLIISKNVAALFQNKDIRLFIFVFLAYLLAVFISQCFRQNWILYPYHDLAPFLYGIPIMLVLVQLRFSLANIIKWVLPLSILATYFSSHFLYTSGVWGDRKTVEFIDPLVFGFTNISIGMVCLANLLVDLFRKQFQLVTLVNLIAIATSILLAIESGSRTGWLAIPLCIIILFTVLNKKNFFISLILGTFIGIIFSFTAYQFIPMVHDKFLIAIKEIVDYPWHGGMTPDSSVGYRITFLRIGFFHFSNSPIYGWGEKGYEAFKDHPYLQTFSTQAARDFCFRALFHNEFMTQSVRYGILGLAGALIVFFAPISFFLKATKSDGDIQRLGAAGLVYMMTLLVSSLSDEVFNLKGQVTFSALIISTLVGSILASASAVGFSNVDP